MTDANAQRLIRLDRAVQALGTAHYRLGVAEVTLELAVGEPEGTLLTRSRRTAILDLAAAQNEYGEALADVRGTFL